MGSGLTVEFLGVVLELETPVRVLAFSGWPWWQGEEQACLRAGQGFWKRRPWVAAYGGGSGRLLLGGVASSPDPERRKLGERSR